MNIKITSTIANRAWLVVLTIFLIILLLFTMLQKGIYIEKFLLPNANIESLYIKLDKKLIFQAKKIIVSKKSKKTDPIEQILYYKSLFKYIKPLFKDITISNLSFNNENISFSLKEDYYQVSTNEIDFYSKIKETDRGFDFENLKLIIKQYHLQLYGKAHSDIKNSIYDFIGDIKFFNLKAKCDLFLEENILKYTIYDSKNLYSLKKIATFLKNEIGLNRSITRWIYGDIVANSYKIVSINGKYDTETKNFFPKELNAKALVYNAKIRFHKNMPKVSVKKAVVTLKNDELNFDIKSPSYMNINIISSNVKIKNLFADGSKLIILLEIEHSLDKNIKKILKAFNVDIPLIQTKGKSYAILEISITLKDLKVDTRGYFLTKKSYFDLAGLGVYSKYLQVEIEDKKARFIESYLKHNDLFEIFVKQGLLDIEKLTYEGQIDIKSINVNFDDFNLIKIKNDTAFLKANMKNDKSSLFIDKYSLDMNFTKDMNTIKVNNLSKIKQYSQIMKKFKFETGSFELNSPDFKKIKAVLKIDKMNFPIEDSKESKIEKIIFDIKNDKNDTTIVSQDGKIAIKVSKKIDIKIKDLNLYLKDINNNSFSENLKNTTIQASNVNLKLKDKKVLLSEFFKVDIDKNRLFFKSIFAKNIVTYVKTKSYSTFNAKHIDSFYINKLFGIDSFKDGSFSLVINSNLNNSSGKLSIKNSIIKNLKLLNNIAASINAIPSIATLQNPHFSSIGYFVDDGYIDFDLKDNNLTIKDIMLKGKNVNVYGKGYYNLKSKKLYLDLELSTWNKFSDFIHKIPLVGYIMLGKNGKISIKVEVTGTSDEPIIETKFVKGTLKAPLNIIKRAIDWPINIGKKD